VIDRTTKLRWRRRYRQSRQQVEGLGAQADEHLETHFIKRISRLPEVRRFIFTWIAFILLLIVGVIFQARALESSYLTLQPAAGGTYAEGMVGNFTNANPLYASNTVDSSVSRLVFSGLLKYNQNNQLVGDLAERWQVDERGLHYTVRLRPNLVWQDGHPLTADDIVFTYQTIQNPDAKSPLANSWQNITITATDARTIEFILPNALSSFAYGLTNGIVPKHLLSGIPAAQLRSVAFNTVSPIGSGPFKWQAIEIHGDTPEERIQRIGFTANPSYHGGKPKLAAFVINTFHEGAAISSYCR
jgi:peptide/nickel transport system substrate-binding protein